MFVFTTKNFLYIAWARFRNVTKITVADPGIRKGGCKSTKMEFVFDILPDFS